MHQLQSTIGAFASISNTEVVSMLFKDTMEKLSKVTLVNDSNADSFTRYITFLFVLDFSNQFLTHMFQLLLFPCYVCDTILIPPF